jgi:integrase
VSFIRSRGTSAELTSFIRASRWLQAGGDISKLSKILGHSSAVTEAHYAHLLKEDLVAASQQVKIPVAPRTSGYVVRMPRRRSGSG